MVLAMAHLKSLPNSMSNVFTQAGIQGNWVLIRLETVHEQLTSRSQYAVSYGGMQHSQTSPYRGSPVEMASPRGGTM